MNTITHVKIGACHIYPQEYTIQYDGEEKSSLQPKFVEVILYLSEHYPRIISREELIDNIWNGNYYVGEKSLTNAIWQLRKALKNSCGDAEVIETIRKAGYRLLIEPSKLEVEQSLPLKQEPRANKPHSPITWMRYLPYFVLMLITVASGWYFERIPAVAEQATITTVTTEPGRELLVSLSPDKRYIAYRWMTREQESNLYVRDLHQPDVSPKQLTFDTASEGHSVWSNDGQYLFFSRRNYEQNYCHIIKMNVTTQQEIKVTDCPKDNGYRYLDISPDDRTLAYRGEHDKALDSGIYFIDLIKEGAKPVRFSCSIDCNYRDRDMAFSPDGKKILVSRRYSALSENLYLVDLETKQFERLTIGEENIVGFSWHPDGRRLVYAAEHADVYNGYVLDIETKKIHQLSIEGFSFPAFTKHEPPSLFYVQREEKRHISAFKLNETIASSPFPILLSEYSHSMPDYSNTAKKVAYVSNESGEYELWTSNSDGKNRERITNLKTIVRYPKWSNDGSRIVFLSKTEEQAGDQLYIVDVSTKKLNILSTEFNDHNRPTWSFDDTSIISSVSNNGITDLFMFDIKLQKSSRLTHDGGRFGLMIAPDKLLYTGFGSKALKQLNLKLEKNAPSRVTELIGEQESFPRYTWGHAKDGIYFRDNVKKHQQITFFRFSDEQLVPLIKFPGRSSESFGALSIVPDSQQILFTQRDELQGNIKQLKHPLFY